MMILNLDPIKFEADMTRYLIATLTGLGWFSYFYLHGKRVS